VRDRLRANAIPIQIPIGSEDQFKGVVDLVRMRAYVYTNDLGTDIQETEIPVEVQDLAEEYRLKLVESVAETDDGLTEKYLEGEELTEDEIKSALRLGTVNGTIIPMLCGSAFKSKGVQLMLDAVIDYLPSPLDVLAIRGTLADGSEEERQAKDEAPFSALAFKVMADKFVGRLTFVRVYSGVVKKGSYVLNSSKGKKKGFLV
jgi:elongation factor G